MPEQTIEALSLRLAELERRVADIEAFPGALAKVFQIASEEGRVSGEFNELGGASEAPSAK